MATRPKSVSVFIYANEHKENETPFEMRLPLAYGAIFSRMCLDVYDLGDRLKPGYKIEGWYLEPDFVEGSKYDFSLPVTQDIKLYAKWIKRDKNEHKKKPVRIKVKIYPNNHSENKIPSEDSQLLDYGDAFCRTRLDVYDLGDRLKPGYIIEGWYLNPDLSEASKYDFSRLVTQEIKLYAKWVKRVSRLSQGNA